MNWQRFYWCKLSVHLWCVCVWERVSTQVCFWSGWVFVLTNQQAAPPKKEKWAGATKMVALGWVWSDLPTATHTHLHTLLHMCWNMGRTIHKSRFFRLQRDMMSDVDMCSGDMESLGVTLTDNGGVWYYKAWKKKMFIFPLLTWTHCTAEEVRGQPCGQTQEVMECLPLSSTRFPHVAVQQVSIRAALLSQEETGP